jgi:Na+-transporting NADH:ubiquinone oxidoreductase subunit NqrF
MITEMQEQLDGLKEFSKLAKQMREDGTNDFTEFIFEKINKRMLEDHMIANEQNFALMRSHIIEHFDNMITPRMVNLEQFDEMKKLVQELGNF